MTRPLRALALCTLVMVLIPLSGGPVLAQIYQWTDENGKVHFGDKPADADAANSAREIHVEEAYVPSASSASTAASDMDLRQREAATQRSLDARREREARRAEEALAERKAKQERVADVCTAYLKDIKALTDIEIIDDIPTYYYMTHDDGTDYTSAEQDAYVQELVAKAEALGCEGIPATARN